MERLRHSRTPRRSSEAGQTTAEYVAVIAIIATLVLVTSTGIGGAMVQAIGTAFCEVTEAVAGGDCSAQGTSPEGEGGEDSEDDPWWCFLPWLCNEPDVPDHDVDLPPGLEHDMDLVEDLMQSERGRELLQWLADSGVEVVVDPNAQGAYYDPSTGTITLGPGHQSPGSLVHEITHAQWDQEGRSGDATTQSRNDYVDSMLTEESDAVVTAVETVRELQEHDSNVPDAVGQGIYDAAYDNVVNNGGTSQEARDAGRQAVRAAFEDGTFKTSNTGESYPDYYGSWWDQVNP